MSRKKLDKLAGYVKHEIDKHKSNNITLDCGRYLTEEEITYLKSNYPFKKIENEFLGCMVQFVI